MRLVQTFVKEGIQEVFCQMYQMSELTPFLLLYVKEQRLYCNLHRDVKAPPCQKKQMLALYIWDLALSDMIIGESWDVNRPVNQDVCLLTQLFTMTN